MVNECQIIGSSYLKTFLNLISICCWLDYLNASMFKISFRSHREATFEQAQAIVWCRIVHCQINIITDRDLIEKYIS